jgi:hypothetical protein
MALSKSEHKKFTVKAELQREVSNLLLETSGLILDGKTFKEIGRARTPSVIPAGLHAQYFQ